jgi:hypothetical protein
MKTTQSQTGRTPLPGRISLGALMRIYPPEVMDQIVEETGRREQRYRLLPARMVMYYVIAMTLFSRLPYREVMRQLVEHLSQMRPWRQSPELPSKSGISLARTRLGSEPLRRLFERVARPLGQPQTRGVWYGKWRLMAIDGTKVELQDTPANEAAFGRPGTSRGERSAFPQLRLVALAESGTHAIVDAVAGRCHEGETTLARQLLRSLSSGMLCLADRNFFSYDLWTQALATGSDLLWRVKKSLILEPIEDLRDGSYLAYIYPSPTARSRHRDGVLVRVIEYVLDDPGRAQVHLRERYRLITSILDPDSAPAHDLAVLYCERWEFETAVDELKTHLRGPALLLRSKTPDGVLQELYGYLLAHYAVRAVMHEAALQGDLDPDRLSFTHSLHVIQRKILSQRGFSPRSVEQAAPDRHG